MGICMVHWNSNLSSTKPSGWRIEKKQPSRNPGFESLFGADILTIYDKKKTSTLTNRIIKL